MALDSAVLEEVYDPDYEPTGEEINEYAEFLGLDTENEKSLLWIAREGLKAPLPPAWKPCQSDNGEVYYYNFDTKESIWDHPCDDYYKKLYAKEKEKKQLPHSDVSASLHPLKVARSQNSSVESLKEIKPRTIPLATLPSIPHKHQELPLLDTTANRDRLLIVDKPRSYKSTLSLVYSRSSENDHEDDDFEGSSEEESDDKKEEEEVNEDEPMSPGNEIMKRNLEKMLSKGPSKSTTTSSSKNVSKADLASIQLTEQQQYDAAVLTIKARFQSDLVKIEKELSIAHNQAVGDLRNQHTKKLATAQQADETTLTQEKNARRITLDKSLADIDKDMHLQIENSKQQAAQKLKKASAGEQEQHLKEIEKMREQWAHDRAKIEEEISVSRAAFKETSSKVTKNDRWAHVAEDVESDYSARRAVLESSHRAQLDALQEQLEQNREKWKEQSREMEETNMNKLRQTEASWRTRITQAETQGAYDLKKAISAAEAMEAEAPNADVKSGTTHTTTIESETVLNQLPSGVNESNILRKETLQQLHEKIDRLQAENNDLRLAQRQQIVRDIPDTSRFVLNQQEDMVGLITNISQSLLDRNIINDTNGQDLELECKIRNARAMQLDAQRNALRINAPQDIEFEEMSFNLLPVEIGHMRYQDLECVESATVHLKQENIPTEVTLSLSPSLEFEHQLQLERQRLERAKRFLHKTESRHKSEYAATTEQERSDQINEKEYNTRARKSSYLREVSEHQDFSDGEHVSEQPILHKYKSFNGDRSPVQEQVPHHEPEYEHELKSNTNDIGNNTAFDELQDDLVHLLNKIKRRSGPRLTTKTNDDSRYETMLNEHLYHHRPVSRLHQHLSATTRLASSDSTGEWRSHRHREWASLSPTPFQAHDRFDDVSDYSMLNMPLSLTKSRMEVTRPYTRSIASPSSHLPITTPKTRLYDGLAHFEQDCHSAAGRLRDHSTWLKSFLDNMQQTRSFPLDRRS